MTRLLFRCVLLCSFALALNWQSAAADDQETGDYIHYRLGIKYKNEKKYDQAIEEFRKVLAAYPDNYNAYMHVAEIRILQKDYRLVVYNLKKALSYNPGWGKAQKMLAGAYESDGQIQKAILELQTYQQTCDPAERDSIQKAVDRLAARVNGQQLTTAATEGGQQEPQGTDQSQESPAKKQAQTAVTSSTSRTGTGGPLVATDFKEAVNLYNQQQYDRSLDKLKTVLAARPDHAGAYYYAGLIRRRNGQNHLAKINFEKGITYPDMGHNAYFYLGKISGEEKNYPEAIKNLTYYLSRTKSEVGKKEAFELLNKFRAVNGLPALKEEDLKTSPALVSGDSLKPQADTAVDANFTSLEIRIDSMLSMITIDTLTDAGQKLLKGIGEFKAGNFDNAVKEFKLVLVSNPKGPVAAHCIYNTGVCYFKLRLYKQSENQFQMILDRYPHLPMAAQSAFLKALSYFERGESLMAEKLFRNFIQTYRDHEWNGKAYEKLGDCYLDLEQQKKAIDAYTQAAGQNSSPTDRVFSNFKLGSTYMQLGNNTRAIGAFQSAIAIGEKHDVYLRVPDSYYKIADINYQQKEYKGALEYYKKVTRKYPSYQETPWGLFQIGSIYKNLNQYQESIDAFKGLMQKYPDDYWAKQAQWKMDDAVWEHEYKAVLK